MSRIRYDRAHPARLACLSLPQEESGIREAGLERELDGEPGSTLSIIIPAKNEAENLPELVAEVVRVFRSLLREPGPSPRLEAFEIIVIDDGSTDGTDRLLARLEFTYPELRSIILARSAGQTAATAAGFRAATGQWVGTLDADLQNPPAELAHLWRALPGHDAALGWRRSRKDAWSRRVISKLANRVRNTVLGQTIRDTGCSVRILSRAMALRLPLFDGAHRFFGPLLLREGCRLVQLPVSHRARFRGRSHYHLGNRSFRVIIDLLGVAWLMRRRVRYEIAAVRPHGTDLPSLPVSPVFSKSVEEVFG
jgi:glycosyltransferase involved in cell wall biosynthesis